MDRILKWFSMPVGHQMYNIGSEVGRAIKWKNNELRKINFTIKAIELLGLTKSDPKNAVRFEELNFYEYELLDYILGKTFIKTMTKVL
jgi:hypothetical protein